MPLYQAPFNSKYYYVPSGWGDAWGTALASSRTTATWAAAYGASITMGGANTTDVMTKSYWAVWRSGMVSRGYTVYGDFFTPIYASNWSSNTSSAWPFAYDLAPNSWNVAIMAYEPIYTGTGTVNGANPFMHYTHPTTALGYNMQSCDIIIFDNGPNAATIGLGVNSTTVTQTITLTNSGKLVRFPITGITNQANNVINFMTQSATKCLNLMGIASYPGSTGPGTSGVGYVWSGGAGIAIHEMLRTNDTQFTADRIAHLSGPTNTTAPFNSGFGFPYTPSLAVIDVFDDGDWVSAMPNTQVAGVTPTVTTNGCDPYTYGIGVKKMIQALRDQTNNACSIVFEIYCASDGINSDVTPPAAFNLGNAAIYLQQYRDLAIEYQCAVLDTETKWGERALALGFQTANNLHPTDLGCADMGASLLAIT